MQRLPVKLKRFLELLNAVSTAAIHRKEKWKGLKSLVHAMFVKDDDAGWKLWYRRLKHGCYHCPIYDKQKHTCGSPFAADPRLGCYCYMPLAAKSKGKKCWLKTQDKRSKIYKLARNKGWGWPGE